MQYPDKIVVKDSRTEEIDLAALWQDTGGSD